jgi:hypothetical protein
MAGNPEGVKYRSRKKPQRREDAKNQTLQFLSASLRLCGSSSNPQIFK